MFSDEDIFPLDQVTKDNFLLHTVELSENDLLRTCELAAIADAAAERIANLLADGIQLYEIFSLLNDRHEELEELFSSLPSGERYDDLARLSLLLMEKLRARGIEARERDFLSVAESKELFAYVKNTLSDEAFEVFREEFSDPRVRYAASFPSAVKLLKDGEVGYCLLPIEEHGGYRLPTVMRLIFQNDLKICSVTPVFGPDGMADLKYALVADALREQKYREGDDRYIEVRIGDDGMDVLSRLSPVTKLLGFSLFRIESERYDIAFTEKKTFSAVFCAEGGDFLCLLVYLALCFSDFSVTGLYKNLE